MATEHVPSIPKRRPVRVLRSHHFRPYRPHRVPTDALFEQVGRPTPGGVTWLWAQGDLDLASVASARRELSALVAPGRRPGIVLVYLGADLFVDLRGLRLLVDTAGRARSRRGALVVVAPPQSLVRLARLSHLDEALPLVGTAREAVRWARGMEVG